MILPMLISYLSYTGATHEHNLSPQITRTQGKGNNRRLLYTLIPITHCKTTHKVNVK